MSSVAWLKKINYEELRDDLRLFLQLQIIIKVLYINRMFSSEKKGCFHLEVYAHSDSVNEWMNEWTNKQTNKMNNLKTNDQMSKGSSNPRKEWMDE